MHDPALHLFVDDHHIRNAFCLKRKFFPLEQDHKPLLTDTDGRALAWGCVMLDDKTYKLWYQSIARGQPHELAAAGVWGKGSDFSYHPDRHPDSIPEWQNSMVGYAESDDGVNWRRPNLGLIEWQGSKNNNMCMDGSGPAKQFDGHVTNFDSTSVFRDDAEADPQKRYKMVNHWECIHCWDNLVNKLDRPESELEKFWAHRAKYLTTSPDGIHWDPKITWIKKTEGGDYSGVYRDERNQLYRFTDRPTVALGLGYFRLAGLSESKDLYHWPEHLTQVMHPGEYEDYGKRYEHHGWHPFNYGDQDLAVLELSVIGQVVINVLCSHRDGGPWKILNYDPPLFTVGPKGALDDNITGMTRNAPFVVDDGKRLRFYYNGRGSKGAGRGEKFYGLFAAHTRLDGFAGMTVDNIALQRFKPPPDPSGAPKTFPAVLQTQELRVTQPQLQLNIANHNGSAKVALLDDSMTAIPGYDVTDCLPIDEDNVRATVKWKDRPDLSAIKGHDVHVLVQLQAGTIYSIRI